MIRWRSTTTTFCFQQKPARGIWKNSKQGMMVISCGLSPASSNQRCPAFEPRDSTLSSKDLVNYKVLSWLAWLTFPPIWLDFWAFVTSLLLHSLQQTTGTQPGLLKKSDQWNLKQRPFPTQLAQLPLQMAQPNLAGRPLGQKMGEGKKNVGWSMMGLDQWMSRGCPSPRDRWVLQ